MKKLVISFIAALGMVLPAIAQESRSFYADESEPIVSAKIPTDQVPAPVVKAVNTRFDKNDPQTWCKFPYALKEYGWLYDVNSPGSDFNGYTVTMKTKDGKDFQAMYNADGSLIESKEMSVNVPVPQDIMAELLNSSYKDWNIVGDRQIIKFYRDRNNSNVESHMRITVEKDNVKKNISFSWNGAN
jgi:hypothetical protein